MRTDIGVRRVAVLGGVRIPFARAMGAYGNVGNQEMLTAVLRGLVDRFRLSGERLGEVAAGAVIKHPAQWNLAREAVLGSGLAPETPAFDLQRACGTSLEAAIAVANKIALGQVDSGIAAGTDTVSDTPIMYPHEYQQLLIASARGRSLGARLRPWLGLRPRHFRPVTPSVTEPRTGLSMGQSCEVMAKQWSVTRTEQDELAAESHRRAAAAYASGFYRDLVLDFHGLDADNNIRPDASVEQLGRLKPAFDRSGAGTLTAGNSTPLTDGAAAVLLASEDWAARHGVQPLAYLTHVKVQAVNFVTREGLLMAPAYAVPAMLTEAGLALQDFDFYEIHEAFAAQVLCTLKAWESPQFCAERLGLPAALGAIDRARLNVAGSSLALGHPFAATGARILATLAKLLVERQGRRGLVSICTAGGMGVTAILER
jgi:acetyl-CoA C-acetyltransferase